MLIRPAIGDTDPIRYRRPNPDGQFSGNILGEAMRPPHWSKQELAEKAGLSEKTITRFEQGQSLPYPATLAKLRAAFEGAGLCFQFDGVIAKGIRLP